MYIRSQTTYSLNLLLKTFIVIVSLTFCDTLFPVFLLHSLVPRNLKRQIIFIHTKDYLENTLKQSIVYMIGMIYHLRTFARKICAYLGVQCTYPISIT